MLQHETLSSEALDDVTPEAGDDVTPEAGDDVTPEMIVEGLRSRDPATQMRAVRVARSILCEEEPPITAMVQAGIIAPLLDALDRNDCPNFQYRALGVLTNVAFGSREHTLDVVNGGAIPKLLTLLVSKGDLLERTHLILGNFALHGAEARNAVLTHGAVPAMLPYMCTNTPIRSLRTVVRTYSNLCSKNDAETKLELVSPALPYIYELLDMKDEEPLVIEDGNSQGIADSTSQQKPIHKTRTASDIVEAACTALANIMLGPDECIEAVQAVPGLTARLVALLGHEAGCVQGAALSAVGNMLAGTDEQVNRCLDANCLDHIVSLLQCSNTSLVQAAALATGNILAGTFCQIQLALKKNVTTPLRNILANGDLECQKQAVYAVTSLACNESAIQRVRVVSRGVLEPYCALLAASDRAVAGEVLDGVHALMQAAERDGNVQSLCYMLDEFDVLDQMRKLEEDLTDENHRNKISNVRIALRKHAREERFIIQDGKKYTSAKIVQDVKSQDMETQSRGARAARRMLREQNPPINALVEAGIIEPLVEAFDNNIRTHFHYVAAWALYKITGGTRKHRMTVIQIGALPKLLAFLPQGDAISQLAAQSLGNIALHGPEARHALQAYVSSDIALAGLRTYVRFYRNLCSKVCHREVMTLEYIFSVIPFISEFLYIEDQNVLKETCSAITYIMDRGPDVLKEVLQAVPGLTARLVALMEHKATDVKAQALNAVTNMLAGTVTQIDRCLDAGCLDHIVSILKCSKPSLVVMAATAVFLIFSKTHAQIQRALEKDILPVVLQLINNGNAKYQNLAVSIVAKLCYNGSAAQHDQLVSSGLLDPYCGLLAAPDRAVGVYVLGGLSALIWVAAKDERIKPLCLKLDKLGFLDLIQPLQDPEIDADIRYEAIKLSVVVRHLSRGEHIIYSGGKAFTPAEIVQDMKSEDLATKIRAVRASFYIFCNTHAPTTIFKPLVLQSGIIAPLVEVLDNQDCAHLLVEVTNLFIAITGGRFALSSTSLLERLIEISRHRKALIKSGVIPKLVTLLSHGGKVAEHAALALANISEYGPEEKDLVLAHEPLPAILPYLRLDTPLKQLITYLSAFRRIGHDPPEVNLELISPALPYLYNLLNIEDQNVLSETCLIINYFTLGVSNWNAGIKMLQDLPGLTERLTALIRHESLYVQDAALSVIINMLSGSKDQVDQCLNANCLDYIMPQLQSSNQTLVWKAADAIKLIFGGTHSQIQRALEKDIITPLLHVLNNGHPECQKSAARAIMNICISGTTKQCMQLVEAGVLKQYFTFLAGPDLTVDEPPLHDVVLSGMGGLLKNFGYAPERLSNLTVEGEQVFNPEKIVQDLKSKDVMKQKVAINVEHYILYEKDPPIQAMVEAGIIPALVETLDRDDWSNLVCEICVLERITAERREYAMAAVEAIPNLVMGISHSEHIQASVAAAVLRNLMSHDPRITSSVLTQGAVGAMLTHLRPDVPLPVLRFFMETYWIFCCSYDETAVEFEHVSQALPYMCELLEYEDKYIQMYTSEAVAELLHNAPDERRKLIMEVPELTARLVGLLGHEEDDVKKKALYAVVHMLLSLDTQRIDDCLDAGCLDHIVSLLQCSDPVLVKVAAAAMVSISRNTHIQIQRVLDKDVFTPLLNLLTNGEAQCQKLAAQTISNICNNGTTEQRMQLVESGVLKQYYALLAGTYLTVDKPPLYNLVLKDINLLVHKLGYAPERLSDFTVEGEKVFSPAKIMQDLKSEDVETKTKAVDVAHIILHEEDPPIAAMVEAGIIATLIETLGGEATSDLVNKICALHKITARSLEYAMAAVEGGAIPNLVTVLANEENYGLPASLAAAVLRNLVIHGPGITSSVLTNGAVRAMLPHLRPDLPLPCLICFVETYMTLCSLYDESAVEFKHVSPALPYICKLLEFEDKIIQMLASDAVAELLRSGSDERRKLVIEVPGLTARLVALLGHKEDEVKKSALHAVVNMLSRLETQQLDHCLGHIVSLLQCSNPELVEMAAVLTSNILGYTPIQIQRALDKDLLTPLLSILTNGEAGSLLQYNAVHALLSLTSHGTPEQIMAVVDGGAVPKLTALLSHGSEVAKLAAGALANIAGRLGPEVRDLVLSHGAVQAILPHLCPDTPSELLRNCLVAYRNFCRDERENQTENVEFLSPALPHISELLVIRDVIFLENACWAIVYLSITSEGIEAVQAVPGLTARVMALLVHEAAQVKDVAMFAVMLMLAGTDVQVDRCLEAECVEHMVSYLECRDPSQIEKSRRATRNSLGATHPHLQRALDKDVLTPLMTILSCPRKVQRQIVRGISNLCRRATSEQRARVVSRGVLEPYCALLAASDRAVAGEALDSLDVLLQVTMNDDTMNPFSLKLVEMGVFDQMKLLREHEDPEINETSRRLLNTYFPE